jgi:hypothetical protein
VTRGISKKLQLAHLRRKRAQAASGLAMGAKMPPKAFPVPTRPGRPPAGLPPAHYPLKRAAVGKRQVPGGVGQIEGEVE